MRWVTSAAVLTLTLFGFSACVLADTFGSGDNQFAIDFVTIGDLGNLADSTGNPNPVGAVPYTYRIGKYEISRDMVTKANAEGKLDITFELDVDGGPHPGMPATTESWNDAARFVNWLNESEGYHAAYKFRAQPGDDEYYPEEDILLWQPSDPGFNPTNPFRNRLANYFLPSADEWYKAAYYDPLANGGAGGYWDFPTGSDSPPIPVASGTAPGSAVYGQESFQGPADIMRAGGLSPYGVMGLGGNAYEWEETEFDLVNDEPAATRGARGGGHFNIDSIHLAASHRRELTTSFISYGVGVGFRVASVVPEPCTALNAVFVALVLSMCRMRRRE